MREPMMVHGEFDWWFAWGGGLVKEEKKIS
jgi:hypothetical protein